MYTATPWIRNVKVPCAEVAASLGLTVRRQHLPACPSCGVAKHGSGKLYRSANGRSRWHCHRCNQGGDAIDLVAYAHFGCRFPELTQEDKRAVREWLETRGWAPPRDAAWRALSPPPRRVPAPRPAPQELRHFCQCLIPVTSDQTVSTYLSARGIDPRAVAEAKLAKAIPTDLTSPKWSHMLGTTWATTWRLALPAYGASGKLESLRARWVRPQPPPRGLPKAVAARCGAGSAKGLTLCNVVGRSLLQHRGAFHQRPPTVVIVEGETDFLFWATRHNALAGQFAIFSVWSGSWTDAIAARIPDGSDVCVRTDNDKAGDRYAARIISSLDDRYIVRRKRPMEDTNVCS